MKKVEITGLELSKILFEKQRRGRPLSFSDYMASIQPIYSEHSYGIEEFTPYEIVKPLQLPGKGIEEEVKIIPKGICWRVLQALEEIQNPAIEAEEI